MHSFFKSRRVSLTTSYVEHLTLVISMCSGLSYIHITQMTTSVKSIKKHLKSIGLFIFSNLAQSEKATSISYQFNFISCSFQVTCFVAQT